MIPEVLMNIMKTEDGVDDEMESLKTTGEEFLLEETKPFIGARYPHRDNKCSYDLVEEMSYTFVHVIKAVNLSTPCSPYLEINLGDCQAITRPLEDVNLEWDQIFAFSDDHVNSLSLDILVKNKIVTGGEDDVIGRLTLDLNNIPVCNRPNKLASEWYKLDPKEGEEMNIRGEILLSIWVGNQLNELFPKAWHSDAASGISAEYMVPKLWYLRVNVIESQNLILPDDNSRPPELRVVAVLGNQTLSTRISNLKSVNPMWNEDLLFVVAEPLQDKLVLTVEEVGGLGKKVLGRCFILVAHVGRRVDHIPQNSIWFDLSKVTKRDELKREPRFSSRIHVRASLEGGYHVNLEPSYYCSDFRPTAKQLWRPSIGVLELGIIRGHGFLPLKAENRVERSDAYCVAKYGMKWVRTRTITSNLNPKWNDQCSWEVFDLFTVLTLGVFDDNHIQGCTGINDSQIGKVRIRVCSLVSGQIYRQKYPLLVVNSSGVKKMGEIELGVRFTSTSWLNTMTKYSKPLFPKMHYVHPLTVMQMTSLTDTVHEIIFNRFDKAEPPLRREVVDYLLEPDLHKWSFRKSRLNFQRLLNILRWFDEICKWKKPTHTILILVILTVIWFDPKLVPSTLFLSLASVCIWNFKSRRSWDPSQMDYNLSPVDDLDELHEEFDTIPTTQTSDVVKMRYDRLRSVGTKILGEVEEWTCVAESFQCLVTWADPRITAVFLPFCIIAVVLTYYLQLKIGVIVGFYLLRPPWFQFFKVPFAPENFLSRLPSKIHQML